MATLEAERSGNTGRCCCERVRPDLLMDLEGSCKRRQSEHQRQHRDVGTDGVSGSYPWKMTDGGDDGGDHLFRFGTG